MSFNNIMLDMETLSSREDAVILSIGAVRFDLETLQVADTPYEFYQLVNAKDCHQRGLRIDFDTVMWWMKQSPEARRVFEDPSAVDLPTALQRFNHYVSMYPLASTIWGNGATFDNMIMRNAFRVCGLVYPVTYRDDLCFRTIKRMFGQLHPEGYAGIKHNALDDARSQANILVNIFRELRAKGAH